MEGTYIFTDAECKKVVEVKMFRGDWENTPGDQADKHRTKLGKGVIAWVHIGGKNPMPKWPKVK